MILTNLPFTGFVQRVAPGYETFSTSLALSVFVMFFLKIAAKRRSVRRDSPLIGRIIEKLMGGSYHSYYTERGQYLSQFIKIQILNSFGKVAKVYFL